MEIKEKIGEGSVNVPPAVGKSSLILAALVFFGVAYLLYANTFFNEWTYDDFPVIVNNPDVLSWSNFFTNAYPGRPLRELSYLLDHAFFGFDPAGWRIQQIFWHGLNGFLIFLFAHKYLRFGVVAAMLGGVLFLVHPIQVETVANISHRKESLGLAFTLMALVTYARSFAEGGRPYLWRIVAITLALTGMLGKETVVAVFPLFLVYERAFIPENRRFLWRPKVLWTLVAAATTIAVLLVVLLGSRIFAGVQMTLAMRANYFSDGLLDAWYRTVLKAWTLLFSKLVFPQGLAVEYVYSPPAWTDPWVLGAIAGALLLIVGWFYCFGKFNRAWFCLSWVICLYLPVSNLFCVSGAYFAADRYLYAPAVGAFLLIALLEEQISSRWRLLAAGMVCVALLCLATLTWQQNKVWASEQTLLENAIRVSPDSVIPLSGLGWIYSQRGDVTAGMRLQSHAVAVNPHYPWSLLYLAEGYERLGERDKALSYFRHAWVKRGNVSNFAGKIPWLEQHLRRRYGVDPTAIR